MSDSRANAWAKTFARIDGTPDPRDSVRPLPDVWVSHFSETPTTVCDLPELHNPDTDVAPAAASRFSQGSVLGRGGMGVVWRGTQKSLRRDVAVKTTHAKTDDETRALFLAEALITARLQHPNIVPVYDLDRENGDLALAMKKVEGHDWDALLHPKTDSEKLRATDFDRDRHIEILIQVCYAITYAHREGIIHLDLKPANIMIGAFGEVYVMDWGLAVTINDLPYGRSHRSIEHSPCGTPAYMAPELATGNADAIGPETDVYLLGAILHETLTGNPPHGGRTPWKALRAATESVPHAYDDDVPRELQIICNRAMHKLPEERYSSAGELQDALRDYRAHCDSRAVSDQAKILFDRAVQEIENEAFFARRAAMYRDFAAAIALTDQARIVWDENPDAHSIARMARFSYAITAIRMGDLELASVHATLLDVDDPNHATLAKKLVVARNTQRRQERTRTIISYALILSVCLLFTGIGLSALREYSVRKKTAAHLAQILRLADARRVHDLEVRSAQLWPANPDTINGLHRWKSDAVALADRLLDHEATLARLTSAIEMSENPELLWQRDVLADLTNRSRTIITGTQEGSLAEVSSRLQFAETVYARSITAHEATWNETITAIINDPRYDSCVLTPQLGLIPLEKNRTTGYYEFSHLASDIVFVLLPGGTFAMGADEEDPYAEADEAPVHSVTLAPFFMAKYEMTQAQWKRLTGKNPSAYAPGDVVGEKTITKDHPVAHIPWSEATRILSRYTLSLPTEAQWEYAARAGTSTAWWTGSDTASIVSAANLQDAYCKAHGGPESWQYEEWLDDGYTAHAPVGSYKANAFGLFDMIGNVREWCQDAWADYSNPIEPGTGLRYGGDEAARLTRGGGWGDPARDARSTYRSASPADATNSVIGVRPIRLLQ
jgi:formylglycine-generating enzyme required for sulfatase activity/tRNA A-37 threonylcarbamoyl transferase component Bud32